MADFLAGLGGLGTGLADALRMAEMIKQSRAQQRLEQQRFGQQQQYQDQYLELQERMRRDAQLGREAGFALQREEGFANRASALGVTLNPGAARQATTPTFRPQGMGVGPMGGIEGTIRSVGQGVDDMNEYQGGLNERMAEAINQANQTPGNAVAFEGGVAQSRPIARSINESVGGGNSGVPEWSRLLQHAERLQGEYQRGLDRYVSEQESFATRFENLDPARQDAMRAAFDERFRQQHGATPADYTNMARQLMAASGMGQYIPAQPEQPQQGGGMTLADLLAATEDRDGFNMGRFGGRR